MHLKATSKWLSRIDELSKSAAGPTMNVTNYNVKVATVFSYIDQLTWSPKQVLSKEHWVLSKII